MQVFIGFDVSLQSTHICVVDNRGNVVREAVVPSEVLALETWLRNNSKGWQAERIVFESGQVHQQGQIRRRTRENALVKSTMFALLVARDGLLAEERALEKQCKQQAKQDEACQRLMTIPGVGPITALAFRSEIDDPTRFKHSREVGVHIGLTPRKYASGEVDYTGRISKCGNESLRTLLFEAAVSTLTRTRKWSCLKAWGVRLAQRSSFKVAATAVARKLAVIMHRMWIDKTNFAYGDAPAVVAA